ncbi:oligoendopeptidase F [Methylococcales bacterium]|nr:oligoendopeptidase F [Methylococcales bacterium]
MSKKAKSRSDELKWDLKVALPPLKDAKEKWDLPGLFYENETDPRIEHDLVVTEGAYRAFAKKHRSLKWLRTEAATLKAVKEYLDLESLPGSKALYYFSYRQQLDATDTIAERALNRLSDRLTRVGNELLFFPLELAKIPADKRRKLLKHQNAAPYRWFLKSLFADAKFQLTEPEEKILNLKSLTSRSLWVTGTEKIINKKTIVWKGKPMPIHGALMQFEQLPRQERHQMWEKIKVVLKDVAEVAENELVALVLDKKVEDELRGYEKPYSATTRGYDSNDATLEKLVEVIAGRGYELSRRFFGLKRKVLGRDLTYIDRNESVGTEPKIPFSTAVSICRETFYDFDSEYGKYFDSMLERGQIDVWPKSGKGGGAFCSSGVGQPTMVFLNHNDSLESLRTLAHEMGHALHAFRSKSQPPYYEGHSILTAETASTFFESLAMESLLAKVGPEEQIAILNGMIGDRIGTMIMCIARFRFELEIHERIRKEGGMTWQEMSAALARHFSDYVGKSIDTKDEHGLIVVSKPHYRMNFYQYSYSFGEIGSSIMRARYKDDKSYGKEVDKFLSAGESAPVEDIFRSIGIDMSESETFHQGLDLLEKDIERFEKLIRKKR